MVALCSRYALRRARVENRMGGLIADELVSLSLATLVHGLRTHLARIPERLSEDAFQNVEQWLGVEVASAIVAAKKASAAATLRWGQRGRHAKELPELGDEATYDDLKAALNLVDARRDDIHRAVVSGTLIPREAMDRRVGSLGAGLKTYVIDLPRRECAELTALRQSQGIDAARRKLGAEIDDALTRVEERHGQSGAEEHQAGHGASATRPEGRGSAVQRRKGGPARREVRSEGAPNRRRHASS
jgi:hypothetical protein